MVGQLANPQLTKLIGQVAAAIRVKPDDGSLVLCKEIPNVRLYYYW